MSAEVDGKRMSGSGARWLMSLAVTVGIALFAIGFFMTLMSMSDETAAGAVSADQFETADGRSASADAGSLIFGLVLSMTGLVVATTVPAACFIRSAKNRS